MRRALRHFLMALALLFGQQAAQAHAFSHSESAGTQKDSTGKAPAGHPAAQCLLYHAIDSAPPPVLASIGSAFAQPAPPLQVTLPLPLQPRIAFDSRAPPVRS